MNRLLSRRTQHMHFLLAAFMLLCSVLPSYGQTPATLEDNLERGEFIILTGGYIWHSSDRLTSWSWTKGDRLLIKDDSLLNLSQGGEVGKDILSEIHGFQILAKSPAQGEFQANQGKAVALENGMIFRFTGYKYHYSYKPEVMVIGKMQDSSPSIKLLVDSNVFDVTPISLGSARNSPTPYSHRYQQTIPTRPQPYPTLTPPGIRPVNGYFRRDGTFVPYHFRTNPNATMYDNFSTKGNTNWNTGQPGTVVPYR